VLEPGLVGDPSIEQTRAVIAELNDTHGLQLTLHSRCDSGVQSGAWLVVDEQQEPAVLKWSRSGSESDLRQLAAVVERIRGTGYPTPAWLAIGSTTTGCTYHLQEFAPGSQSWPLTIAATHAFIDVLERQAGLDPDPARDRSAQIGAAVVDECVGGLRHTVRQLGPSGIAIIARYDELLDLHGVVDLPRGDMVHGDFNTCNILLHRGAVSAVIDIEELGSGTRVIDYGCLLREAYVAHYDPEVRVLVRRAGEAVAGPGALAVCVAAAAFFIVGFKLRYQPEVVVDTVEALRRLADDLAEPLGSGRGPA
jgi:aminoglycoside phosphotransferase (APT) family kinase protein